MARVFRISQVNGDGSSAEDRTFEYFPDLDPATGKPFVGDDGEPSVAITLRTVTRDRYREFVKAHTTQAPNKDGVLEERIDWEAVNVDVVLYAIVGWRGFVGADDRPLRSVEASKRALDPLIQNAVRARAMFAQPAEVAAASFRQPADVPALVGRLG